MAAARLHIASRGVAVHVSRTVCCITKNIESYISKPGIISSQYIFVEEAIQIHDRIKYKTYAEMEKGLPE